ELAIDLGDLAVGRRQASLLVLGDLDVEEPDRHAAPRRELEADALDAVDQVGRLIGAQLAIALVDELLEIAALHDPVVEPERIGDDLVEDHAADGRPSTLRAEGTQLGIPRSDLDVDDLVEGRRGLLAELVGEDRLVLRREGPN